MRKGALTIIFVSLIAIVVILSFGTITQGLASNNAAIEVDNKNSEILITPTGNSNHLILPEIIATRFIKISGLTVGDEVRDDFPVIYVKEDAGKVMRVTFNTLWGK